MNVRLLSVALLLLLAGPATAQDWPARPVKFVISQPPGASPDIVARFLADKLSRSLGQQVIVENRPGGQNVVGAQAVAKAPADGYTYFFATTAAIVTNPLTFKSLPYDPEKDFTPVAMIAKSPMVIAVNPSIPARTLAELIAYAKANPDKLNFGSSGNGTTPHLAGELFNTMAGVKINHIPYKGSAPMVTDLLGNQVQVAFDNTVIPNVKAGKLRALAATGTTRLAAMPDVPTAAEAGLPGYEAVGWMGVYGPKGTPQAIVNRLAAEIAKAMATPDVREKLAAQGFQAATDTPAQFDAYLRTEQTKWAKVARDANVQPE